MNFSAADGKPSRGFSSLLVANRGEIARRVFRTARNMGLRTVAVFVDADADAPFVWEADAAMRLPVSYLHGGDVIAAALAAGAEAVHPGYGFLAENASFAQDVIDAGLVWIGPRPAVIKQMGDKIAAKEAAVEAGLPTLPSSQDPTAGEQVGFPLLVKASAGGGGKGMRLVESAAELGDAVAAARREALSSFGDGTVFLERWLRRCRHIEIQVLGDAHGNVVHLGERECSIQRRHQKIIEESPSVAVDAELRALMGEAAVGLAKSIGYDSAGTVELLLSETTGEFFLEMNTRLQVEHPVTEAVTGIDLVREQLRMAAGQPIGYDQSQVAFTGHAIEVRLCAEDSAAGFLPATGTLAAFAPARWPEVRWDSGVEAGTVIGSGFDSMLAKVIAHAPTRHEASARLALALERLHLGGVTTNRTFLAAALRSEAFLLGDTTTDFVDRVTLSQPPDPMAGRHREAAVAAAMWLQASQRQAATTLGWMPSGWRHGRLPPERVKLAIEGKPMTVTYEPQRDGSFIVDVTAASDTLPDVSDDARSQGKETAPAGVDSSDAGSARPQPNSADSSNAESVHPQGAGVDSSDAGSAFPRTDGLGAGRGLARVVGWTDERIDLEWNGRRIRWRVTHHGNSVYVTGNSATVTVTVLPRFGVPGQEQADQTEGGFAAPMPGQVLEVRITSGQTVKKGQSMVVLEGMKMEHHVSAPSDGIITELLVAAGDQVDNGTPLLVFKRPTTNDR